MCRDMEDLCSETRMVEKGKIALNLKKMGMSLEQIAEALEVNVSTVEKWLSKVATPAC